MPRWSPSGTAYDVLHRTDSKRSLMDVRVQQRWPSNVFCQACSDVFIHRHHLLGIEVHRWLWLCSSTWITQFMYGINQNYMLLELDKTKTVSLHAIWAMLQHIPQYCQHTAVHVFANLTYACGFIVVLSKGAHLGTVIITVDLQHALDSRVLNKQTHGVLMPSVCWLQPFWGLRTSYSTVFSWLATCVGTHPCCSLDRFVCLGLCVNVSMMTHNEMPWLNIDWLAPRRCADCMFAKVIFQTNNPATQSILRENKVCVMAPTLKWWLHIFDESNRLLFSTEEQLLFAAFTRKTTIGA